MADATYQQTSFLGGEWSQSFQGRSDRPDYRTGMNVCLNVIPIEAGAAVRRPGTRHAAPTRGGVAGRTITFDVEAASSYTMEFTDGHLRMFSGYTLVTTNDEQTVTSISAANPAKVLTGTHGWTSNDQVMFSGLGASCPLLHNRPFTATVTSTTEFTLTDAITGATIDGATLGALPAGAKVNRILDIATPYGNGIWATVRSVQAEMTTVLLNAAVQPYLLTATAAEAPDPYATFTFVPQDFVDGPYLDPVAGSWVVLNGRSGLVTLTLKFQDYDSARAYSIGGRVTYSSVAYESITGGNQNNQPDVSPTKWTAISQGLAIGASGFQVGDIGRHVRLISEPPDWNSATDYSSLIGTVVKYNNAYWTVAAGSQGRIPGVAIDSTGSAKIWVPSPTGFTWTWGKIVSVGTPISGTLAGSANIGDMTQEAGLAAAFDGVLSKHSNACAAKTSLTSAYLGKNYSGATAQAVSFVVLYPSSNRDFQYGSSQYLTFNLRAKATLPANSADGTLLGTIANVSQSNAPVTVASNDTLTTWNYVWVEIIPSNQEGGANLWVSQLQIYNPSAANATQVTVQIIGDAILATASLTIKTWRLGLYSNAVGWPVCGVYHEGRLWLSGTVGNRIDSSRSGKRFTFSPTEADGTVSDSCGISYTFDSKDVNTIYWMTQDQQGIICGTQAGEWLVQASNLNSPLTPTSIQAHRVTKIGCANIEPRRTEHTLVFVQKFGRKIMEYFSDVFSGKFSAPNLSEKAKHLTKTNLLDIAYQQELAPIIWGRRTDGALVGATYKRESLMSSQGPTFAGWHRHALGSAREVQSISVGPSVDGNLDSLTLITNDTVSNIRHVEVMTDIRDDDAALTAAWFLDNAVVPTSYAVSGSNLILTGLWHLNGKSVSVFAGGIDAGDVTVSSGSATVPLTTDLTAAYVVSFAGLMPIVVGFTYTSQGQILRPMSPVESGARTGPAFGKLRRSNELIALLVGTRGISFGTKFTKLRPAKFQSDGGVTIAVTDLFTGTHRMEIDDTNSFDSMLCWQVSRPYPANIAAIGGFLQTSDG